MALLQKNIKSWWKGRKKPINLSINSDSTECKNCGYHFNKEDMFCSQCGQKNRHPRLSVGEMLNEALSNVFGYDSKFWTTLRYIFHPGILALMYQHGQRVSILHPVRLFFFLFLILALLMNEDSDQFNIDFSSESAIALDTTNDKTKSTKEIELFVFPEWDSSCSIFVDITIIRNEPSLQKVYSDLDLNDDLRYIIAKRQVKFIHNQNAYGKFVFNSLIWVIFILQPILAFFFKIILRKYYFSDHIIWSLYLHSSIFIGLILLQIFIKVCEFSNFDSVSFYLYTIATLASSLFILLSVNKFYKKSLLVSLLILFYLGLIYLISGSVALILNFVIGFLLF